MLVSGRQPSLGHHHGVLDADPADAGQVHPGLDGDDVADLQCIGRDGAPPTGPRGCRGRRRARCRGRSAPPSPAVGDHLPAGPVDVGARHPGPTAATPAAWLASTTSTARRSVGVADAVRPRRVRVMSEQYPSNRAPKSMHHRLARSDTGATRAGGGAWPRWGRWPRWSRTTAPLAPSRRISKSRAAAERLLGRARRPAGPGPGRGPRRRCGPPRPGGPARPASLTRRSPSTRPTVGTSSTPGNHSSAKDRCRAQLTWAASRPRRRRRRSATISRGPLRPGRRLGLTTTRAATPAAVELFAGLGAVAAVGQEDVSSGAGRTACRPSR